MLLVMYVGFFLIARLTVERAFQLGHTSTGRLTMLCRRDGAAMPEWHIRMALPNAFAARSQMSCSNASSKCKQDVFEPHAHMPCAKGLLKYPPKCIEAPLSNVCPNGTVKYYTQMYVCATLKC
jgi:hypothetical protein